MLVKFGYRPLLLLRKDLKDNYENLPGVEVRKCLPAFKYHEYEKPYLRKEDKRWLKKSISVLCKNLKDVDLVITHDILYIKLFFVLNVAIRYVAKRLKHLRWLHWIHSPAYTKLPIWKKMRRSKLVIPNREQKDMFAEKFGYPVSEIETVYHHLYPDSLPLHPLTKELIDAFDLLNADIVQLYPADTRRSGDKQITLVIKLFARLKKRGKKVRLVIANSYCDSDFTRGHAGRIADFAFARGLNEKEVLFTSRFRPPLLEQSIPHEVIIELFHYATNLFIFPSRAETFSLITFEAASGGNLLVLNEDLLVQKNIIGENALFYKFGSYRDSKPHNIDYALEDKIFPKIVDDIIQKLDQQTSLMARQRVRQKLSAEWVFKNQLEPLLNAQ